MDPEILKGTQDKYNSVLKTEIGMQKDATKGQHTESHSNLTKEKPIAEKSITTINDDTTKNSKNIRNVRKRGTKKDDDEQTSDAIMSPTNPFEDEVPK